MKKILIVIAFVVIGSIAWNLYKKHYPDATPKATEEVITLSPIVGGVIYDRSGSSPLNKVPIPVKSELLEWCNLTTNRDVYLFFGEIQSNSTQNFLRCELPALKLNKPLKPDRAEFTSKQYTQALKIYSKKTQQYELDSIQYFDQRQVHINAFAGKIEAYFANIKNYSNYTDIYTALGVVNTIYNEFSKSDNFLILLSDGQNTRKDIDTTSFNHEVYTVLVNGAGIRKTSIDNMINVRMESFAGSIRSIKNKFNL